MSKRHQSNRRKNYGRRQHEVSERRQRDQQPAEMELGLDDLVIPRHGRTPLVPRSAHAAHALRAGRLIVAVFQGARQRTVVLPRRPRVEIATPALPRRRMRSAVRARRGPSRISLLLAAIVVAFAGAFFSLSQDIRVSATGYEMDRLATQQRHLQDRVEDLHNELNRLGKAPAIRKQAIDAGLGPLPEPVVVSAR